MPGTVYAGKYTVTLIPGDGIGHEMAQSVKTIFKAAGVPVEWEQFDLSGFGKHNPELLKACTDSIRRNKVALKGEYSMLSFRSPVYTYTKEF